MEALMELLIGRGKKGIVWHQSSVSSPISHYANECSMRVLVRALETTGVSQCSKKGYQDLVDNLKDNVVGLGDLKVAKTVMNFASSGFLFITFFFHV
jgi:hypothetical protein